MDMAASIYTATPATSNAVKFVLAYTVLQPATTGCNVAQANKPKLSTHLVYLIIEGGIIYSFFNSNKLAFVTKGPNKFHH